MIQFLINELIIYQHIVNDVWLYAITNYILTLNQLIALDSHYYLCMHSSYFKIAQKSVCFTGSKETFLRTEMLLSKHAEIQI